VDLAGRSSDFEAQAIDAVKAEGTIAARNLMITDTGYPTPIRVQRMQMAFDPAVVDIPDLALSWLGSDLEIRAKLDNFVPYALGKAALDGEAQLTSKVLDLRPFQGETTEETADEPAAGGVVVVVPDDLALTLQARFTEVVTQELSLRDMVGQLSVADQAVVIDELKASMLGGRVSITGRYAARTPEAADIDFRIEALRFDLPQTVREFATLARIAPVLKGVTGSFDSDFQLTSRLDREGNPDLAGLTSSGSLLASGLRLTPVTLNGAAEKLKRPSLSALEVGKRRIDFVIEQGKLRFVEPFEAKLGGYAAQVSGGAGIVDRTLDLAVDLDLPVNAIAGSSFLEGLGRLTGDTVGLQLGITGGYDAPKLAIRRADADAPKSPIPLPDPRERLVAEATEKGDALVAAAEDRAAKIRAQAKTRADDLRREGRQQAKRIEREAGSNPIKKAAAKTAADAARRTAYKAADKAENEADKQADKIVAEARKQRAKLIAEASGG
ncbi:MAG: AsmA-like C-terminal region-containing protein, partial [Myxococcota bacterium]